MSKPPPSRADIAYARLMTEARRHHGGGCRVLSQGSDCMCELCDLDILHSEIQRLEGVLARIASAPIADDPAILRETLVVCRRLAKDTIT